MHAYVHQVVYEASVYLCLDICRDIYIYMHIDIYVCGRHPCAHPSSVLCSARRCPCTRAMCALDTSYTYKH